MFKKTIQELFEVKIHKDQELKHLDSYFTDPEEKKFVFAWSSFNNFSQLNHNWEDYQNQDIALYLQNEKYGKQNIRWDIYYLLFYPAGENIDPAEIFKIEKDRHICRKIIIEYHNQDDLKEQLINKLPFSSEFYDSSTTTDNYTQREFYSRLKNKLGFEAAEIKNNLKINNGGENENE